MSVVLIVAALWITLAVALALFLGRTVRVAEKRERGGADPLSTEPVLGDAHVRVVDPTADSSRGLSLL